MQRNSSQPQNAYSASGEKPANGNHNDAQKKTQDQEEKERRQAEKDLTQSWMDRLQLISVITTFFASTEAGMLQVTSPAGGDTNGSASSQLANATFLGALVLHIWAAIISFLAAFFLVRYNLKEAKKEQQNTDSTSEYAGPLCRNPYIEQIGPFQSKPPTHLLSRCHNLCILLTFAGFGLALLGILAFAWGQNPVSVGVVTSVTTAFGFAGGVWVFLH
ncbi:hypothetical protein FB45DRAFT_894264 [Roridomyces roridus]|uniref:Transmembrane protein n=1 Tax=Roridomyces roridus TaxID=1738132 RepID=A0AAD7CG83_9AGAR|nr:hypothetical protein FB45DRAFT_894264 [Roridomyces roridus]